MRRLFLLAVAVWTAVSFAAPPESTLLSAEAALAGAVLVGDDEGGGGYYNPASLAALNRRTAQVGVSAYSVGWVNVDRAVTTELPWETRTQSLNSFRYDSVPSAFSASWEVLPGLGVSLGAWTTYHDAFAATLSTRSTQTDPSQPGLSLSQRADWNETTDDRWAAVSLGWQMTPAFRVGASLQGAYATDRYLLQLDNTVDITTTGQQSTGAHLHKRLEGTIESIALRAVVGSQWQVTRALRLALVLRTPRLQVAEWGFTSRSENAGVSLPGYPASETGELVDSNPPIGVKAGVTDHLRVLAGVGLELGALKLRVDGEWSPRLRLPDGTTLSDSLRARVGALYTWNRDWLFGLGATYDRSRTFAADGNLSLNTVALTGGCTFRPEKIVRALGGGDSWDLLSTVAGSAAYGYGTAPSVKIVPLDVQQSVFPVLITSTQPFLSSPANSVELSLHLMTTLKF